MTGLFLTSHDVWGKETPHANILTIMKRYIVEFSFIFIDRYYYYFIGKTEPTGIKAALIYAARIIFLQKN